MNADSLKCAKCGERLVLKTTNFEYLGNEFRADIPQCPKCGMVFIDESLVHGKMHEVETEMEDK